MDFKKLLRQLERAIASGNLSESDAALIIRNRTGGQATDLSSLRTLVSASERIREVQERPRGPSLPARAVEALRQHPAISGGLLTERGREDLAAVALGGLRGVRNITGRGLAALLDVFGADAVAEMIRDETFRAADLGREPERFPVEERNPILSAGAEATATGAAALAPFMGAARVGGLLAEGAGLGRGAQLGAEALGTAPLAGLLAAGDPELSFFPGAAPGERAAREAGIDVALGALAPIFVALRRGGKEAIKAFEKAGLKQVGKIDDTLFLLPDGTMMGFEGARDRASLALHPEFARRLGAPLDDLLAAGVVRVRPEANASFVGFQRGTDLTPAQRKVIEDVPITNPDDTILLDDIVNPENAVDIPPEQHGRARRIINEHSPPMRESDKLGGDPREKVLERLRSEEGRAAEVQPEPGIKSTLDLDAVDPETRADILSMRERGLRFLPAFYDEQNKTTVATGFAHFTDAVTDPVRAARLEAGDVTKDGFFDIETGRFLTRDETSAITETMGESSFVRRAEGQTQAISREQARADIERHAIPQPSAAREIPRQFVRADETDAALFQATRDAGGATFNPRTGEDMLGSDLFAVSRGPDFERPLTSEQDLAQFRADFADELAEEGAFLGTWIDPDTGVGEVNITDGVQSLDEAVRLGRARDQKSIVHLGDPAIGQGPSFPDINDDLALAFYRVRLDEVVPERHERQVARFLDNLTPKDAERFAALTVDNQNRSLQRRVLRNFSLLGDRKRSALAAIIGAENQQWYDESASAVREMFGDDAPRFAAVLAATSPQSDVEENMELALGFWRAWERAGRPTDPEILTPLINGTAEALIARGLKVDPGTVRNNLTTTFTADDAVLMDPATYETGFLSGNKVDAFTANLSRNIQFQHLLDRMERATIDTHIKRGHGFDTGSDLTVSQLLAETAFTRSAAQELSGIVGRQIRPEEVQAMEWSTYKAISDRLGVGGQRRGRTYSQVVEELIETGDPVGALRADIAETPSFSSILNQDRYDPYLTDLGIEAPTPLPRTIQEGLKFLPENIRPADVDNYLREIGKRMDVAGEGGLDRLDQGLLGLAAVAATLGGMTAIGDDADPFALAAGVGVLGIPISGAWRRIALRLARQGGISEPTLEAAKQSGVGLAPLLSFMVERPGATVDELGEAFRRMGVTVQEGNPGALLVKWMHDDMQAIRQRREQAAQIGVEARTVRQNDLFGGPGRIIRERGPEGMDPEGALEDLPRGLLIHGERTVMESRRGFGGSVEGKFGQRVPFEGFFEPEAHLPADPFFVPRPAAIKIAGMGPDFVREETLEAVDFPRKIGTGAHQIGMKGLLGQIRAAAEASSLPGDTRLIFERAGTTGGRHFRTVDLPLFPEFNRAGTFVPQDFRRFIRP